MNYSPTLTYNFLRINFLKIVCAGEDILLARGKFVCVSRGRWCNIYVCTLSRFLAKCCYSLDKL